MSPSYLLHNADDVTTPLANPQSVIVPLRSNVLSFQRSAQLAWALFMAIMLYGVYHLPLVFLGVVTIFLGGLLVYCFFSSNKKQPHQIELQNSSMFVCYNKDARVRFIPQKVSYHSWGYVRLQGVLLPCYLSQSFIQPTFVDYTFWRFQFSKENWCFMVTAASWFGSQKRYGYE